MNNNYHDYTVTNIRDSKGNRDLVYRHQGSTRGFVHEATRRRTVNKVFTCIYGVATYAFTPLCRIREFRVPYAYSVR